MKHSNIVSEISPHEACRHANEHLAATSNRKDIHWVVRNGRVVVEFIGPPESSLGKRVK